MIKICPICRKEFEGRFGKKYCSAKCRDKKDSKSNYMTYEWNNPLAMAAVDAREHGLSYGQAQALKLADSVKIERKF